MLKQFKKNVISGNPEDMKLDATVCRKTNEEKNHSES